MSAKSIKAALSAATCVLLQSNATPLEAADEYETEVGASSLLYAELKRVIVSESAVSAKHEYRDDEYFTAKIVADAMTGASPSGASRIDGANQTFTTPSGNTIEIKGDSTPVFEFTDFRSALNLGWIKPLNRTTTINLDGNVSRETDYESMGLSGSISKEFNKRMTTISFGIGGSIDEIEPEHGIPVELSISDPGVPFSVRSEEEGKTVIDGMLGITQVLNKRTLVLLNYSVGSSQGYLTDPYKIISHIDDFDGLPLDANGYYFEKRPTERLRQTVYFRFLRGDMGRASDLSYRYFWDDWGVRSHTVDFRHEFELDGGMDLQWHGRIYGQTQADFYHYHLYDGTASGVDDRDVVVDPSTLNAASGDYRLGNLNSYTFGAKLSWTTGYGRFGARAEYFYQHDRNDRFEPLHALITQLTWKLKFF